ncbi:hypothetical protein BDZ89DRAFT_438678, partial [Hymenopellis radicata]
HAVRDFRAHLTLLHSHGRRRYPDGKRPISGPTETGDPNFFSIKRITLTNSQSPFPITTLLKPAGIHRPCSPSSGYSLCESTTRASAKPIVPVVLTKPASLCTTFWAINEFAAAFNILGFEEKFVEWDCSSDPVRLRHIHSTPPDLTHFNIAPHEWFDDIANTLVIPGHRIISEERYDALIALGVRNAIAQEKGRERGLQKRLERKKKNETVKRDQKYGQLFPASGSKKPDAWA